MSTSVEYILEIDTKGAQQGLKKTNQQVKKTARNVKSMRANARGLSGSFQAVGEAAGFMAPELAGLGEVAMVGARTFRGLGRTLASGHPIIIGLTLAIGGAIAVFAAFNAATKREEASKKALSKSIEENTKKIKDNAKAFEAAENAILSSAGKINNLRLKYAELSGEVSKAEAAEMKRSFTAEQTANKLQTDLDKQIESKQESLKAAKETLKATKKRLDDLGKEKTLLTFKGKLTEKGIAAYAKEEAALKSVTKIEREINALRTDGVDRIEAQAKEYAKLQEKIDKELKRQEMLEEAISRAKERQTQLQSFLTTLQGTAVSLASRLLDIQIARKDGAERINAEHQKEIDNLTATEQQITKQFEAAEKIARTKKDKILLTQIQAQKEAALASIQALRGEAEIKRQKKIFALVTKSFKLQLGAAKSLGKQFGALLKKRLDAIKTVDQITKSANDDQLTALERINQVEQERLKTLRDIAKQQNISTKEAQDAARERAKRERSALSAQQVAAGVGGAETVVRAVSDPSALISAVGAAFGPVGMAVAGVANALADLGQQDPEEIKAQFKATFEGIAAGLKILAPLLIEMLPPILFDAARLIVDALIQLPFALLASLGKLMGEVVKGIKDFFSGKGFFEAIGSALMDMFDRLINLIIEPFTGLFGGSKMGGGRMLSGQGGLRFTGANRGLSLLHEGEMVVPRSGQMSSSVARDVASQMRGSGGVNITINSAITERSAIDGLVRKIEERFGGFGQSTSTLFGGT